MSNYPLGAEHDSNAPFNRKELQGETIGLFEYLENLEMPYEVRIELNSFITNHQVALMMTNGNNDKFILTLNRLLQEPQIFIENE
jgi:hypothetical protein